MAEQEQSRLEIDPFLIDWVTAACMTGKVVLAEVEADNGEAAWLLVAESESGEKYGLEAAIYDGDTRIWLRTGFQISTSEGSQGRPQPAQHTLDGRVPVIRLNRTPASATSSAGGAMRRATYGNCLEHSLLGYVESSGEAPGQRCEECGKCFVDPDFGHSETGGIYHDEEERDRL